MHFTALFAQTVENIMLRYQFQLCVTSLYSTFYALLFKY